jgi:hypothetical protein
MTDDEYHWRTSSKVQYLAWKALPFASPRRWRLTGCAFLRQCLRGSDDGVLLSAAEASERFADGGCTAADLDRHFEAVRHLDRGAVTAAQEHTRRLALEVVRPDAERPNTDYIEGVLQVVRDRAGRAELCEVVRDLFGNPFRPVAFDSVWRTPVPVALAARMYEARDFGPMPILADALQDAGCDNEDVLSHCRDPRATHVRGCWVVDGVLGRV